MILRVLYFTNFFKHSVIQVQQVRFYTCKSQTSFFTDCSGRGASSLPHLVCTASRLMPSPSRYQAFVVRTIDQASEKSKKQVFHVSGDVVNCSRHRLHYFIKWVGF